uniref:Uncharacterized protein n=1 Tax=Nelumbo nucifera TaxID=4432 RepID=A0A822Z6A2_NELNU|nr:TPA_asm: hypothetical protein HUJ06_014905 [Nelumbo nucifera]
MDCMISSKSQSAFSQSEKTNYSGDRQDPETNVPVTTRLYLKPSRTSETLDKDDVLRRIRHRKRVNKVRNALQALLNSPLPGRMDDFLQEERWLEDAFSAP